MKLSPTVKVRPNVPLFTSASGFPHFGVLVRLKNSARNSRRRQGRPKGNARKSEKSRFHAPGSMARMVRGPNGRARHYEPISAAPLQLTH